MNYTMTHCHTSYSLLDSCTSYQEMIDTAVNAGMKAIAFTEHGLPRGWVAKALYCKKKGIKFLHGVEVYLTEQLEPKVRDNYHTVLIAKNEAGVKELNALVSTATDEDHFYYVPRIDFDTFLAISDNIISTSACLASPLNKLPHTHPRYMELARKYTYLEVQPHLCDEQAAYNKWIVELAQKLGKPLIAGTDTHSSSAYKAECRQVLLEAKGKTYPDDEFDLSFHTYEELLKMFEKQMVLSKSQYEEALENTNRLADMCDEIEIDTSTKYPISNGTREKDSEVFADLVERKFKEKVASGVIPASEAAAFRSAIDEEMRVFRKLHMDGWMLSMADLIGWCKEQGFAIGPGRGSVGGSRVAFVTGISEVDPEKWNTNFARFCNENRTEIGDIDTDVVESDRPMIFKHIVEQFGQEKTARVASYGTIQGKGVIDDVGRCLAKRWAASHNSGDNPWSLKNVEKIKAVFEDDEEKARKKYPELFYYFDGLIGTMVSQSVHPAGMVISPIPLRDTYGCMLKDGEWCLLLDMEEAHACGLAKYDMLCLKTVEVIRDCYQYLGEKYPTTAEIDFDDQAVYDDMMRDPSMIFQFESKFAADSLKRFQPTSIPEISLVTACIRPSGASYRDAMLSRKTHKNPSEIIDKLLEENGSWLVYQEDTIAFLQQVCGFSGSRADTVRRGIAKKDKTILDAAMPDIIDGYCAKSDKPRKVAESECQEFVQILQDSSAYQFNKSHSIAYSIISYICGMLRHYHPLEFVTAYLNNAGNDTDIQTGTIFANKNGIKVVSPKFGISRGDWFFDRERNIIAKGLSSVKYMSDTVSMELYNVSCSGKFDTFTDLLYALNEHTSLDTRQLDILIRIDYFSDFGNQSELLAIASTFTDLFKKGEAKQLARERIDGTAFEQAVKAHSSWTTKDGKDAKSYKLNDAYATLIDIEKVIKGLWLRDANIQDKVQAQVDYFGHVAATGDQADRATLIVDLVYDLHRKKDGRLFGYSVTATSLGSGKQTRYTVFCRDWNRCGEVYKGDIIHIEDYKRDGEYFTMTDYSIL